MLDWCTRAACPAVQIIPLCNISQQFQSLLLHKLHSPSLSGLQWDKQNRILKEKNANITSCVIMHQKQKNKNKPVAVFSFSSIHSLLTSASFFTAFMKFSARENVRGWVWLTDVPLQYLPQFLFHSRQYFTEVKYKALLVIKLLKNYPALMLF